MNHISNAYITRKMSHLLVYYFTILCFLYPKICLSHKITAVTDSELEPPKIAVIYTLHTKELFSAFKHKIQINNLSLVRRKI